MEFKDLGDVEDFHCLEELHINLEEKVEAALKLNYLPICVGGGNDQSYPNGSSLLTYLSGLSNNNEPKLLVINIDAHLDVRPAEPKPHSGSPFRQLVQHHLAKNLKLIEFGAQGSQCSAEHANWVIENGGEVHWLSKIEDNVKASFNAILDRFPQHQIFFSFDIDSIIASDCPGVSCPAAVGLSSKEALELCLEAGRRSNVRLMDISEYNPVVEEYRTGRLISYMIYYFLLGLSQR